MTKIQSCCGLVISHGSQGHSLSQGHPPPNTSKLPLQTNSVLSIVMSASSKESLTNYTETDSTTCTLNPLYTMTLCYLKHDPLWIFLPRFLQEKQHNTPKLTLVWRCL